MSAIGRELGVDNPRRLGYDPPVPTRREQALAHFLAWGFMLLDGLGRIGRLWV